MRFMYDGVTEGLLDIRHKLFTIVSLTTCFLVPLQLFRDAESSILEIIKADVVSSIEIPIQV